MKIIGIYFYSGKKTFVNVLYAIVVVTCLSCNGQNANNTQKVIETKQEVVDISNELVPIDTTNIETTLQNVESFLYDLKNIHVAKASDTLKYEYLKKKWANMDITPIRIYDRNEVKHSIRVKYYTLLISLYEEISRVNDEAETAGLKGGFNENKLKKIQESMDLYKRKLWLETH